jgi:hypothetical protein
MSPGRDGMNAKKANLEFAWAERPPAERRVDARF